MDFKIKKADERGNSRKKALYFIVLMGIVSFFGDITYEGARSITGPYLAILGASAGMVGFVSGIGEFIGYALRLVSGYFSDRTKAYWPITITGYAMLIAIPCLAFTDLWQTAAVFIIMERMGKGIRTPARDAILSHATKQVGRGFGFGLHEAMDQIGAIIGPLIFSTVFLLKGGYGLGFTILWIPALLCVAILIVARKKVSSPADLEAGYDDVEMENGRIDDGKIKNENIANDRVENADLDNGSLKNYKMKNGEMKNYDKYRGKIQDRGKLSKIFWIYSVFTFFSVAGFASFQIISYHFKIHGVVSDSQIPVLYAVAMGVDALVALIIGKTYDKIGLMSLITIPLLTIAIPFFAFSLSFEFALISAILWGAVMGIHETIMRAAIADLTVFYHRGTAYGIFNTIYGCAWFFGSTIMGFLYDASINFLFIFVIFMEIAAILVFFILARKSGLTRKSGMICR